MLETPSEFFNDRDKNKNGFGHSPNTSSKRAIRALQAINYMRKSLSFESFS